MTHPRHAICNGTAAERQRRYRERVRDGVQVVVCEVDQAAIEGLIAARVLEPELASNSDCLANALIRLAKKKCYA